MALQLPKYYESGKQFNPDFPVYEARDIRTGVSVAIKFGSQKDNLVTEDDDDFRERLKAEALLLGRWAHCANVVRLLETHLDRRHPFLVLELLGSPIESVIPEHGLSLSNALAVMVDVTTALVGIHRLGDAHGDITPNNILLHPHTGHWTLIDPGASRLQNHAFSCEYLHGWQRDLFMVAVVFITLITGAIDTQFDGYLREWFADQPAGDRLIRITDRMLWHPRSRHKKPRGSRPTAVQVLSEFRRAAKMNS